MKSVTLKITIKKLNPGHMSKSSLVYTKTYFTKKKICIRSQVYN